MSGLHIDSVIKNYGDQLILSDIFIKLQKGEIIGLLGRNGSGKSTLLKIIFGSISADRKFVKLENHIVNSVFDSKNGICYLPQHHFLPDHVKIKTLIGLFCKDAHSVEKHDLIKNKLHKNVKALSGGERRIVEIILSIHSGADYILLDEPFNGIAPLHKELIKSMIIAAASKNKGFIITDHDYRNILDIATRNILLHDGYARTIKCLEELKKYGYLANL